ncbi:hydroxymethylglutaryl-CoA synthase, partial [Jeotgalibaca porci]
MKIGIDKIGFYGPPYYVDMVDLANERGDDPSKYTIGIGQAQMAVAPLSQDIVSMAVNAALVFLDDEDRAKIDLVVVGTESGFDASKSASVYVHELLGIQPHARSFEVKQACYGATAGIQMAKDYVTLHPDRAALVIGTDVARYGLATGGEVTQGAGAIAMLITANPRILQLDSESAFYSRDIMDFWRPSYSEYAMVDGKYSNEQYIAFFKEVWATYKQKTAHSLADFAALCFHLPYTKMGKKAFSEILN